MRYKRGVESLRVYLEIGAKRVFAGALDWPGWNRGARDEAGALEGLIAYGPRYKKAIGRLGGLMLPKTLGDLEIIERLKGDSGTDFGVASIPPSDDARAVDATGLRRLRSIMTACWRTFDAIADAAEGARLTTGPRGGGRSLDKIRAHELEGQLGYLSSLGVSYKPASTDVERERVREAFLDALGARARGELPDKGPRGGARWTARYAARRAAWHTLDHAWEIEDRS